MPRAAELFPILDQLKFVKSRECEQQIRSCLVSAEPNVTLSMAMAPMNKDQLTRLCAMLKLDARGTSMNNMKAKVERFTKCQTGLATTISLEKHALQM